jgi:branched-chain amino acid aminotransferase
MKVYMNGKFLPKEQAVVSVFDHGFLYGDGIYETLRAYDGMVFKMDGHMKRLQRSADAMHIKLPASVDGIAAAVYDTMRENALKDAFVRIHISRGPGEIGLDPDLCSEPTFVIVANQFHDYPPELFENGVKVAVVGTRRNHPDCINPAIKSTNSLNNIFAKIEAKKAGAYEGIMLNHEGLVAEGTICNVFIVKKGKVLTPPLNTGILEGVTRDLIIKLAKGNQIPLSEEPFTEADLMQADEAFISNTTMEIMPVTQAGGSVIGGGVPGSTTRKLMQAYKEEVLRCLQTRTN